MTLTERLGRRAMVTNAHDTAALLLEAKARIEALEEDNAKQPGDASPARPDGANRYFIMEDTVYWGQRRIPKQHWKLYDKTTARAHTHKPLAFFYSEDIATHTCAMMNGTASSSSYREHVLREQLGKAIHDAAELAHARDVWKGCYDREHAEHLALKAQAQADRNAVEDAVKALNAFTAANNVMHRAYEMQARELQAISDATKGRTAGVTLSEHVASLEQRLDTVRSDRAEIANQRDDFKRLWETHICNKAATYAGDTAKGWHDRATMVQEYMEAAGAKLIAIRKVIES